jgi:hypothetical protein
LFTISPTFKDKERLDSYEILDYINRTINRYIKEKYLSDSSFKEKALRLRINIGELNELVNNSYNVTPIVFTAIPYLKNAFSCDLPSDFLAYIRSDTEITRTDFLATTTKWVNNEEVDYKELDRLIETPNNKPLLLSPVVTIRNHSGDKDYDKFITVVDRLMSAPINNAITYIKQPTALTYSITSKCELAPFLHEEIVRLSVNTYVNEFKMRLVQTK